jgi:hypothetical protein
MICVFHCCRSSGSSIGGTGRCLGYIAEEPLLIKRKDLGISALKVSIIKRKSVNHFQNCKNFLARNPRHGTHI